MSCSAREVLQQTPLYHEHVALQARMVPFAGWQMPLQYSGILSEYEYTRRGVTLFDTSHMGEFLIEGDAVKSGLDRIITCRISDMPVKTCRYGAMLNTQGGIIDDLTVSRLEENTWFIVVNAAHIPEKARHFQENLTSSVKFQDISLETGKLDLQGPLSRAILSRLVPGVEKLEYFSFDYFDLMGARTLISRTGYTGELGYEIYFPWERLPELWKEFLKDERVKPAGLGVRDLLRLEMGYSLYGQDLNETTSPLEAGLNRFVDFEKDFIGKPALLSQREKGPARKMIAFTGENRRSPRAHHKIYSEDLKEIGEVTSGIFSPALERGIGMGYIQKEYAFKGKKIFFGDEKNRVPGEITAKPFYKNATVKN